MKCADFEVLLCDYLDGTLDADQRHAVEEHQRECSSCAEFARDVMGAVAFMERAETIDAPPELLTRITFEIPSGSKSKKGDWRSLFGGWLQPVLQPRFAMGMAMTILSFSMIGRMAGIPQRPLQAADLEPTRIWSAIDTRAHRAYDRLVKYVDNLRLVYEIQNRLGEWSAQEEQASAEQGRKNRRVEPAIPAVTPDERENGK